MESTVYVEIGRSVQFDFAQHALAAELIAEFAVKNSREGVKITETEFFTSPKSRIQHGRKFNVDVTKNLKMIYEQTN